MGLAKGEANVSDIYCDKISRKNCVSDSTHYTLYPHPLEIKSQKTR